MTGNCLMGSRPLLVFDKSFYSTPEWQLLREMFKQVFAVPLGHPKSKPFVDHIMSFFVVDNKIWIRNYLISERGHTEQEAEIDDSFTGKTLYANPNYVSPSVSRSQEKKKKTGSYAKRVKALERLQKREEENILPEDELADVFQ